MYKFVILQHFNDLLLILFELFPKLGPNLHLSYVFSIFRAKLGKNLYFIQISHLMLLKLNHIFFVFQIVLLFLALIQYVLLILSLQLTKLIQKKEVTFIECLLWEKLKISNPSSILNSNFHQYYQLFSSNIKQLF